MILATLATEIQNLSEVFLTVNVWFKGRELEYHNKLDDKE